MDISQVVLVTDELVAAFQRLIPQLSAALVAPTQEELAAIVASPATILFIARDPARGDEIVGALTLVLFRIPSGVDARIEDVVVDADARGKGIGKALMVAAIERATSAGAAGIDLTSRPSREAANEMYRNMGFVQRETNVYHYALR
jgi:ribosomal protein S18 acetylase RimI-like enzyme